MPVTQTLKYKNDKYIPGKVGEEENVAEVWVRLVKWQTPTLQLSLWETSTATSLSISPLTVLLGVGVRSKASSVTQPRAAWSQSNPDRSNYPRKKLNLQSSSVSSCLSALRFQSNPHRDSALRCRDTQISEIKGHVTLPGCLIGFC